MNQQDKYDFNKIVSHEAMGNMKYASTPEKLKAAGIVSLGGAEMDFATAPSVIDAITARAKNGLLGYTILDGTYLDPIVWWMKHVRNFDISSKWIVPTLGTIYSVATAIRLLCGPDDAILTMPPVYYRYEQAATRLGRKTLHCPLIEKDGRYDMDFPLLEQLMARQDCRLVVLCNPQNPVGRLWTEVELTELARLSAKYQTPVFSDEIFAEVTYDGNHTVAYASIPEGRAWAITATSLGKTFNFTGVNQANMIIPDEDFRLRFEKQRTIDHYGSIDPLFHAAITGAYCQEGLDWLRHMRDYLDINRKILTHAFKQELTCFDIYPIEGTFVGWIRWNGIGKKGEQLVTYLRENALLEVEPGDEYGDDYGAYTRMSFATATEQICGAIKRIKAMGV